MPWKEEVVFTVDSGASLGEAMHGVPIRGHSLGTTKEDGQRGTCTHDDEGDEGFNITTLTHTFFSKRFS